MYVGDEQPPPSVEYMASLQLVESNFQLPNGNQARREHIMVVLQNLRGLYIRATYWTESVTTKYVKVNWSKIVMCDKFRSFEIIDLFSSILLFFIWGYRT